MQLLICHPYGVSRAVVNDDATDEEIKRVISIASTIEEGNGNGRVKTRAMDGENSQQIWR